MKNKALAAPYLVWMAIFTVVPLGIVIWFSFTDSITGAFTFDNISRMGTYLPIFLKSIWLAILSSLICLVIGYPVAYCLASAAPERRSPSSVISSTLGPYPFTKLPRYSCTHPPPKSTLVPFSKRKLFMAHL